MSFEIKTLEQRPDLKPQVSLLAREGWPTFLLHADTPYWARLHDTFAGFQILFCDASGTLVALGHTIPFIWDGDLDDLPPTINEVMGRAVEDNRQGLTPNTLCALAALVTASQQRRGLSAEILKAMRSLAAGQGMHSLVAPVRPTLKSRYPLTPIDRYALWKRDDGSPFDPWIRVHWRLGAEYLKLAPEALVVMGTVAEWEEWTGMTFPGSGEYVIPGALQPITLDRERDAGRYVDPNVWMRHPIT